MPNKTKKMPARTMPMPKDNKGKKKGYTNESEVNLSNEQNLEMMSRANKHGGRFTSIVVRRKTGTISYCAKIQNVTPKTIRFLDVNANRTVTVRLDSVVSIA